MRLKEWDFYQVSDGKVMIQINFFNISLATCATFGFVDLTTGRKFDTMSIELITPRKNRLNRNGDTQNSFSYKKGKTSISFNTTQESHTIKFDGICKGKTVSAEFVCRRLPEHESITIATPFREQGHFFYTNKINCLATQGRLTYGDEVFDFSPDETYTVLDWGRGMVSIPICGIGQTAARKSRISFSALSLRGALVMNQMPPKRLCFMTENAIKSDVSSWKKTPKSMMHG